MTNPFPVPLDNLIAFVRARRPEGDPLAELAEAVAVANRMDEQSDALISHFVDQARRSGASWSQIGAQMGVSKQAVQKRFVPRTGAAEDDDATGTFSRFTPRARTVLGTAAAIGGGTVTAPAIVLALFAEPDGLGARALVAAGISQTQLAADLGLEPAEGGAVTAADADPATLRGLDYADDARALLAGTVKAVLRLGHNYVGTEHLLLGALFAGGPAADALAARGVTVEGVEAGVAEEIAAVSARRSGPRP